MNPQQYFDSNSLWDFDKLKEHCEQNLVWIKTSDNYPGVVLLHYKDEVQYDKAWNEFNRMCRGLILDVVNKKVLAHGYNKFHNLDEVEETGYSSLLSLGRFETSEKLDGSMLLLFRDPNTSKLRFSTKGSLDSEQAVYANSLSLSERFWKVAEVVSNDGTLIFELISKQFQIVVDYKKKEYTEGIYLIGYREFKSGKLASFDKVACIARELGVPTFKTYEFKSLDSLIDTTKNLSVLEEGFVLRFSNDLMVKVKGPKYLEAHRFISNLSDRNILNALIEGTAESLTSLAPEEYRNDVLDKIESFKNRFLELKQMCYNYLKDIPSVSRKEAALLVNRDVPNYLRGFVFQLLDGKEIIPKQLYKTIEKIDKVDGRTRI